ncbi:MAG: glycosyltransferase [Turicibacter sanguinis]|uniref:glycosyltransferase n=1 Tax=Turicibacter sanguinis TaxID=154288 RepID=UPI0011CA65E2|nr:glycosyltransferase [Turicibacter sanguinis]MTP73716.1 glycosyltransferase [Turicibacter sanguinis]
MGESMKEISIVMRSLGGGGAEKVLVELLNLIDFKNYSVKLLVLYKEGIYINQINKNVKTIYMYDSKKYNQKILQAVYCRGLMFIYKKFPQILHRIYIGKVDVEIAFLEGESTRFVSMSCSKKSKKIAWVHSNINMYPENFIRNFQIHLSKFDEIVCVSNQVREVMEQLYPETKSKLNVILNLINTKDIIFKSKEFIEYDIDEKTIICCGRLVPVKRFDVIIKALSILHQNNIFAKLIILGEGPERENLLTLIRDLNLVGYVDILGFIPNPYPYIKHSDIFVSCSDYEGYSLALAEALVLGKVCVSTDCTGPVEMLDNGIYGSIVSQNNPNQLADILSQFLTKENLKKYWEAKALERSIIFDEEKFMDCFLKVIN